MNWERAIVCSLAVICLHAAESPEAIARKYCQSCHVFPDPALLDKKSWVDGALRRMAPLLGAARIDLDRKLDGQILKEANVFPLIPLVSGEDWRAITQFYNEAAPEQPAAQQVQPIIEKRLSGFTQHPLGYPGATPLVSLVRIDPSKRQIFVGNAGARALDITNLKGELVQRVPLDSAPVDLAIRHEGIYLTLIGDLFPSDERKGKIVLLSTNKGALGVKTLVEGLARPTSTVFGDFNGDGLDDMLVCAFGNYLGKIAWYERALTGGFAEHTLLEQPGAVNAVLRMSGPSPQIYLLTAQAREGIHRFTARGGTFEHEILAGFHPAFGSSHLEIVDVNKDGAPDLLVTNGDNGDYFSLPKNYHGIRLYLNDGHDNFREKWFFALNGAFKAMAGDFDSDGDVDIAAISFFPDFAHKPEESFVFLRNDGALKFTPESFPECTFGRWLTMDTGDVDGDGDMDIVLGSFAGGPASISIPPQLRQSWSTNAPLLWLENTTHAK